MHKKLTSLLILLIILVNMFAVSAFAEAAPSVTVGSATGEKGNTVSIPVVLSNNTGFSNLGIEIGYDESALTLKNVVANSEVGCTFTPAQSYTTNPYNMSWDSAINATFNGTLATLTFEIIADTDGTYPITVDYYKGRNGNYIDGNNVNYDENFAPLNLAYVSGKIEVGGIAENSISVDNSLNVSLTGDTGVGKVYAAIYEGTRLKQLKTYTASKNLNITFDSPKSGDVVKVMWWNDDLQPMCKEQTITLP